MREMILLVAFDKILTFVEWWVAVHTISFRCLAGMFLHCQELLFLTCVESSFEGTNYDYNYWKVLHTKTSLKIPAYATGVIFYMYTHLPKYSNEHNMYSHFCYKSAYKLFCHHYSYMYYMYMYSLSNRMCTVHVWVYWYQLISWKYMYQCGGTAQT